MATVLLATCAMACCVALAIVFLLYGPARRPRPFVRLPRASLSVIEPFHAGATPATARTVVEAAPSGAALPDPEGPARPVSGAPPQPGAEAPSPRVAPAFSVAPPLAAPPPLARARAARGTGAPPPFTRARAARGTEAPPPGPRTGPRHVQTFGGEEPTLDKRLPRRRAPGASRRDG